MGAPVCHGRCMTAQQGRTSYAARRRATVVAITHNHTEAMLVSYREGRKYHGDVSEATRNTLGL